MPDLFKGCFELELEASEQLIVLFKPHFQFSKLGMWTISFKDIVASV